MGQSADQTIPVGSIAILGEYKIEVKYGNRIVDTIDISCRSGSFVVVEANGLGHFGCEIKRGRLNANNFANLAVTRDGLAQGFIDQPAVLGDGRIKAHTRTALTFGGIGGI